MADARHIVEIILKATDRTQAAFASALANEEALKAAQRDSAEAAQRNAEAQDRLVKSRVEGSERLADAERDRLQTEVKLDQAAQQHARTLRDVNATEAEHKLSLDRLAKAESDYSEILIEQEKGYKKANQARKEVLRTRAEEAAQSVRNARLEEEAARGRTRSLEATARAASLAAKRHEELNKQVNATAREIARTEVGTDKYRALSGELQKIQNQYKDLGLDGEKASKITRDAVRAQKTDVEALNREMAKQIQLVRQGKEAQARGEDAALAGRKDLVFEARVEAANAFAEARRIGEELNVIAGKVDWEAEINEASLVDDVARIEAIKAFLARPVEMDVKVNYERGPLDRLQGQLRDTNAEGRTLLGFFRELRGTVSEGVNQASSRIAVFDNILRGLTALGITLFFQNIVLGAGAAGAALLALASSAGMAAAALGGTLVAGIAQAIPAFGILATAISRVKAVTDALQQANLLKQQGAQQDQTSSRAQASANRTLAAAQERVAEAQDKLTEARRKSRFELEALIIAEKRASLGVKDAQDALNAAVTSGVGNLTGLRLDLQEAQANRRKTQSDLSVARTQGTPGVQQAKAALDNAQDSLKGAQEGAKSAEDSVSSSANKLSFLMSQLSDAEKRLFQAMQRLQTVWRHFAQEAAEPLINAFTGAIDKVTGLLKNNAIISATRQLSATMAAQFSRIFRAFTSPEILTQFGRIMKQAGETLRPLTTLAIRLGRVFLNIGEAGGPALLQLTRYFARLAREFNQFLQAKGREEIERFFLRGLEHLKAWFSLIGSIGRVFGAIAGAGGGAAEGLSLIEKITNTLNTFADNINDKGSKTNKFFRDLFTVMRQFFTAMRPVFAALGAEIARLFGDEAKSGGASIKGFANVLIRVLIPAFGNFLRLVGLLVRSFGSLVQNNPALAKLLSTVIATVLAFSVLGRVATLFEPFIKPVIFLVKQLPALRTAIMGAAAAANALGLSFAEVLLAAAWPIAIAAGIAFLLVKFHLLDDVIRGVRDFFTGMFDEMRPSLKRAQKDLEPLLDALGGPKGLMGILKRVMTLIVNNFTAALRASGRIIGATLGGALDVIFGVMKTIIALIKGDWSGAWEGVKQVFGGIWHVVRTTFEQIFGLAGKFVGNLLDALGLHKVRVGFEHVFEGLGDFIGGIFNGILSVITDAVNIIIDGLNVLIDAYNLLPGHKNIDTIDHIGGADVRPTHGAGRSTTRPGGRRAATGGAVPGQGAGDTVAAWLTPGEHVWTAGEVQAAGGQSVMYALRRLFGGGGQSHSPGYAEGGEARAGVVSAKAQAGQDQAITAEATRSILVILRRFGNRATNEWRDTWRGLERITRVNMNRMEEKTKDGMADMLRITRRRGGDIVDAMRRSMRNLMGAVYTGFDYVGDATRAALDVFDARVPKLNVPRPRELTRATGGWIGNQGERGRDAVRTVLGRGEAVLNWGQQKIVNSALWNQYGTTLDGVFKGTRGFHAGGEGQLGFAGGGFTGPHGTGAAFTPITNFAMKKFGLQMTAGRTDHNYLTTSGNVSDHSWGGAGDFSNGVLTPQEDAFSNFWLSKAPQVIKQLIWRNKDQQQGFYVGGHEDHVHLAVQRALAFDAPRMSRIISRAARGLSISELMQGLGGVDVEHVSKVLVEGVGALKTLSQKAIDKVRGAANKFIDKVAMRYAPGILGANHAPYDGPLNHRFPQHALGQPGARLSAEQVTEIARAAGFGGNLAVAMEQIAHGESDYYPGVVSSDGGYGLWQMTPRVWGAAGIAMMNRLGGLGAMLNPFKNALMAKYLYEGAGNSFSPWYGTQYLTAAAKGGYAGEFATGGVVGGRGRHPEGQAMAATVHIGEWVLNKAQQNKLAGLLGKTRTQIKNLLGFDGSIKDSFDNGGEVVAGRLFQRRQANRGSFEASELPLIDFGDLLREANFAFRAIRHMRDKTKGFYANFNGTLDALTKDGGLLDQMNDNIERFTSRLQATTQRRFLRFTRGGGVARVGERSNLQRRGEEQPSIDEQEAAAEQEDRIRIGRRIRREGSIINRAQRALAPRLADTRRALRRIQRGGVTRDERDDFNRLRDRLQNQLQQQVRLRDRDTTNDQALVDNMRERFEAAQEALSAVVAKAGKPVALIERIRRVLEARGQDSSSLAGAQIAALKDQEKAIAAALKKARRRGMTDLADQLEEQLGDIQATIAETISATIQALADKVNDQFGRTSTTLDLFDRALAVRSGLGDTVGAARGTEQVLAARRNALLQQRTGLQGALAFANAAGNTKLITDLNAQLAEIGVQLQENTLALKDAATATRQASFDLLVNATDAKTGLGGTLGTILESLGTITGQDTSGGRKDVLQQMIDILSKAGDAMRDKLFAGFGVDLRGLEGTDFVGAVQNIINNFDSITAGMTTAQREQFNNWVNAIVNNESAVLQNTQALNELTGATKTPATWSTSSWTMFREAIFNGMGDILPQFQVPSMQSGGFVTKSGIFNLHAGERVFPLGTDNALGTDQPHVNAHIINPGDLGGDTNITINEAGKPVDATYLANRLAFERRTARSR